MGRGSVCLFSLLANCFISAHLNNSLGSAKQGKEESISGRVVLRKTSREFDGDDNFH